MKNVVVEKSTKERIESITIGKEKFSLMDEFNYADGGTIIGIMDNETLFKEEFEGTEYNADEAFFSMEDDKAVPFKNVACKLDIREGDGGYVYFFDNEGNELYED